MLILIKHIVIYGVINSSILVLTTMGFALVYSISRIPNFSHGAFYVIGAYFTWLCLNKIGLPYPVAIALGTITVACFGAIMFRYLLLRVRGLVLSEMIGSFAIGLGVLELIRYKGLKMLAYHLPPYVEGNIILAGISVDYHRIIVVIITIALLVALRLFTHHTKIGLSLRGVAQDEQTSMNLGINSDRTGVIVMAIGSGISALAGIVLVPLSTITVSAGYEVLIYALAVCVLGGLGNLGWAVSGAIVLGITQSTTVILLGTQWQMVVALLAIVTILLLKPSGLFGKQKALEERV